MSRKLMRVPLDFNYPINKVWEGYINPCYKKCPCCENGYTPARVRLNDLVRLLMLSGSDSLKGKNHPYFDNMKQCVNGFNSVPSKDMAELTKGLAGREPSTFFGHDSSDNYVAVKKIIKASGLPKNWGICESCKGENIDATCKKEYKAWKEYKPAKGKGYQMWETCTEGSPQSPVFKTLDELCEWCEVNATTFADFKTTKENWKKMLTEDFVNTAVNDGEKNIMFI